MASRFRVVTQATFRRIHHQSGFLLHVTFDSLWSRRIRSHLNLIKTSGILCNRAACFTSPRFTLNSGRILSTVHYSARRREGQESSNWRAVCHGRTYRLFDVTALRVLNLTGGPRGLESAERIALEMRSQCHLALMNIKQRRYAPAFICISGTQMNLVSD